MEHCSGCIKDEPYIGHFTRDLIPKMKFLGNCGAFVYPEVTYITVEELNKMLYDLDRQLSEVHENS